MPPAIATKGVHSRDLEHDETSIREIINAHHDWFMSLKADRRLISPPTSLSFRLRPAG